MAANIQPQELILVDSTNQVVGSADIFDCHVVKPQLHRALSVFLFNGEGKVLLQKRSSKKLLWPGFWSNSCCTHPRVGEKTEARADVRIQEELGTFGTDLRYLYSFEYRAKYLDVGIEHEYCDVFVGTLGAPAVPNPEEVESTCLVTPHELTEWMCASPNEFTPWSLMEWKEVARLYAATHEAA